MADRDERLLQLSDAGILALSQDGGAGAGAEFPSGVTVSIIDGLMRLRGTARTLHVSL
jgi:hypothetical protein